MHESPSIEELLQGVSAFLEQLAGPDLADQKIQAVTQFQARVSANALALISREIAAKPAADARALTLYRDLLNNNEGTLQELEARLCEAIARGYLDTNTPGLLQSLRVVAGAQLDVDQPKYRGGTR
jgi:hypothetical protein